ncbi:MAG: GatB/YqeY domain-containing protein [Arenimonas sp.]|nr:GatB/YqeY domain-containing protein [Arenimonas sp.]MBP7981411.1 GatB/YqeY domain-containing protein [Arenimonas sp.]
MSLKAQLTDDMKTAMKAGDKERLGVIRLMLAALKQREVDERIEITDDIVLAVLEKMLKQRKDSISQFEAAGRDDLAKIEKFESGIIQAYMPQPLSADEVQALVTQAILDTGAEGPQAMGKVIAALKPQLAGRADMGVVSGLVKNALAAK